MWVWQSIKPGVIQAPPALTTSRARSSAFAGSSILISPELLVRDGLLKDQDLEDAPGFPEGRVDYRAVITYKRALFRLAFERFQERGRPEEYERFTREHACWLDDFALFAALKTQRKNAPWIAWPVDIRDRKPEALVSLRDTLSSRIEEVKFLQSLFHAYVL